MAATQIQMKNKMQHLLVLAAAAAMVGFFTNRATAQGNFDPAAARERQMTRYREDYLGVKSDEDWKKIEPLVGKVMDAQRATPWLRGFGGFGGRGRGGGGGGNDQANANPNRNRFGGTPLPEQTDLQKAIEEKAPVEEIKSKLAKLREARKAKEMALDSAREDLRKALSSRQEAGAVLAGLLK